MVLRSTIGLVYDLVDRFLRSIGVASCDIESFRLLAADGGAELVYSPGMSNTSFDCPQIAGVTRKKVDRIKLAWANAGGPGLGPL